MNGKFLEIRNLADQSACEGRNGFLRETRVAFRRINQLPGRAVGELDLRGHAVRERQPARSRPGGLGKHSHGLGIEQETKIVEKMARLPQHAPAALRVIGIPMLRVELPSHYTKGT